MNRIVRIVALLAFATLLLGIGWSAGVLESGNASGEAQGSWQVKMDVSQKELPTLLNSIDASCDVEIESQGVSFYVVAYRCVD